MEYLLRAKSITWIHLFKASTYRDGTIMIPILQMKILMVRGFNNFALDTEAIKSGALLESGF